MLPFCFYEDSIVSSNEATMNVHDLSTLRGYGVFDFLGIEDGILCFWEDYYNRFYHSCEYLGLTLKYSSEKLASIIADLISRNELVNGYVRLLMTGGYVEEGFLPEGNNRLAIYLYPEINYPDSLFEDGSKLLLQEYVRPMPKVKTTNYSLAIARRKEIKDKNAFDLLYHNNGFISESSRSNIFLVKNGVIITPDTDILEGITRKQIIKLASALYPIEIRPVSLIETLEADEVFICSTTKGTLGIVQIDDAIIHDGRVGPVTKELRNAYYEYRTDYIASQKNR